MPGALSYLIERVEGLEKTAQSLLNRQEECCSPHWMDVDELCNYIPSPLSNRRFMVGYQTSRYRTTRLAKHWFFSSQKLTIG